MPKKDNTPLETYEWDSPWWEHTENKTSPRALYIGDSISNGTRPVLNSICGEKLLFDGFPTSKALDNPYYIPSLELFMSQEQRLDFILFNNGLHGWHLSTEEYGKYYDEMLAFLVKKGVPVYVVLTTFLPDDTEKQPIVSARNDKAAALAEKYGLKVIDLYSVSKALPRESCCGDGVHFHADGYTALAESIVKEVLK